jgi:hypothetical protein
MSNINESLTWKEWTLHESKNESHGHQLSKALYRTIACRHNTPDSGCTA